MCQISADAKNLIQILKIIQGLSLEAKLIQTLVLVEISLGKESNLGSFEGKLWQLLTAYETFGHHGWENALMIDMHSKFYEARLIRTMFLVEISLGKEPDLAGFEGKLWQLINSCWQ